MLYKIYIKNFALLEKLEIFFSPGLNVLTGETGAGKSLVINALNSILGEKVSPDLLRNGSEKAVVEGLFQNPKEAIDQLLRVNDLDSIPAELWLRREINRSGRSRTFVNDGLTQMNVLKQISGLLVDLHGQHDHQSLLKEENHILYLDLFGRLEGRRQELRKTFFSVTNLVREQHTLLANAQQLREKKDYLQFQIREIDALNPAPDEEDELRKEERVLENYEKIVGKCSAIYFSLYEQENSVYSVLGSALSRLEELAGIDAALADYVKYVNEAYINVEEVAHFLNQYKSNTEFDPERLEQIRVRLSQITRIKKKYGLPVAQILEKHEKNKQEIGRIENLDDELRQLAGLIDEKKDELEAQSKELSRRRKEVAKKLERKITAELKQIGMENVRFRAHFDKFPAGEEIAIQFKSGLIAKSFGIDRVGFYVSTNPGENFKPLAKIVSGGELSRIMLALKTVLAEKDQIEVLVFDEIDSGISGRIAETVGRKLKQLSGSHQVICVTHLPQIAAFAESHFSVRKQVLDGETFVSVHKLDQEERIREVALLLGGEKITDATLKNAQELIEHSLKNTKE
ncbi:MAG TPA: DNA repair protein RecN [Bacteroidetes bacterium]|nr:DNA repair protein RecN [Bacteroidota bacterium]